MAVHCTDVTQAGEHNVSLAGSRERWRGNGFEDFYTLRFWDKSGTINPILNPFKDSCFFSEITGSSREFLGPRPTWTGKHVPVS